MRCRNPSSKDLVSPHWSSGAGAWLGESGCGKSKLLRMIAGLEEITSGDIIIDDVVVNYFSPRDRNIAMVFQSYARYPNMTVEQNICFPLLLAGVTEAELKKQLNRAADMLNLDDPLRFEVG